MLKFLCKANNMSENKYNLSHLEALEAESIYIFREATSEFKNPVMLYSVGKDSSVLLELARKAFYPGKIPFPLCREVSPYLRTFPQPRNLPTHRYPSFR